MIPITLREFDLRPNPTTLHVHVKFPAPRSGLDEAGTYLHMTTRGIRKPLSRRLSATSILTSCSPGPARDEMLMSK